MKIIDDGILTEEQYNKLNRDDQMKYWRLKGNKFILIKNLEDEHLQRAFCFSQTRELLYHNKLSIFNELVNQIEAEAGRRGLSLSDIDTEYHKNTRKYKSKVSALKKVSSSK